MIRIRQIIYPILLPLVFATGSKDCFGQQEQTQDLFRRYAIQERQSRSTPSYYIVSFRKDIPVTITISRKLDEHTAIVSEKDIDRIPVSEIEKVRPASNSWKLAQPQLTDKLKDDQKIILGGDLPLIIELCRTKYAGITIIRVDSASQTILIKAGRPKLLALLDQSAVRFFDAWHEPETEIGIIGYDRSFHGINTLSATMPGANGHGVVVGIKEQKMEEEDLDLYKRVLPSPLAADKKSDHATVIASIIGGAGNSFYDGLGIAGNCHFFPSSFADLFPDDINTLKAAKVSVQNHSYGTVIQQFYGAEALSYDAQTSSDKELVHVFSAGNQGNSVATDGRYANIPARANLTGNFKMAKNIITVGAIGNKRIIAAESSAGPLYDGRLAPQLIALGPNGTSDAAAMVTGAVAVLQQVYADSNYQMLPSSSLIRAILFSSADDIYTTGIDHKTGYGLLNIYKAIKLLQKRNYFSSSLNGTEEWSETISVPLDISSLKISISWNDVPATLNACTALVNDLDLELTNLQTGEIYRPWILSSYPHADSLRKLPVRGRDSLNTSEQISLREPPAGTYSLKVTSRKPLALPVDFAIAYCIDTLHTFRFTNPQQTADVNAEENNELTIRWAAEVSDSTDAGDLSVSYDHGENWQAIAAAVRLTDNSYRWALPAVASRAILKMNTSWGSFLSNEFVISQLTRPQLDFVCTDSFRLSWNKHIYANAYAVYGLTDSAYMKKLLIVADTFIVIDRKKYSSLVYAVQPVLSNNLPAARSIAQHIELQGAQCFFRTLNYVLEDGNRLRMILDLSAPSYADSVFFEQVTQNGTRLKMFGSAKADPGRSLYTGKADQVISGTIYIRAAIRLKTGVMIYTDIIPVLTSGGKEILFYPNPVRQGESLRYVIRQGISPDCRLQIFDVYGRLIRDIYSLPVSIDVSGLASGIYFLKLTDRSGKKFTAEKIIIP